MPTPSNFLAHLKATLRMASNRLRLVQQKESAIARQNRRELSQLMEIGKVASAKIRVEIVIREDLSVELLEILELYCSLILARIGLIDKYESDERLREALYTVIYAAPHVDVKELTTLKDMLRHKLPKEFIADATENASKAVPDAVYKRIHTDVPSEELVTSYLREIAKAYNVTVAGIHEPDLEFKALGEERISHESEDQASAHATKGQVTSAKTTTNVNAMNAGAGAGAGVGADGRASLGERGAEALGRPTSGATPSGKAPPPGDDLAARFAALRK